MSQHTEFEINEDLTNVTDFAGDGGGAPALPPGEYVFDVVDIKQATSKTNNPKIEVTFEVVEGEYTGVRLMNNYSLLASAIGRVKRLMMACGAQLDRIRSSEILGARVRATVVHNPGQPMQNADGTTKEPRIFANVCNERPLEDAPVEKAAPVAPPPVTRSKGGNGAAVRRA